MSLPVYISITIGPSPVSLAAMKTYLKITSSSEDALIQEMIDAATLWGEGYTGRAFRVNVWKQLRDDFCDLVLKRDPIATVDSIKHLVDTVLVTVDPTLFYTIKQTQESEILLFSGKVFPSDTDDRQQAVEINFTTEAYYRIVEITSAIKRHVAYWYSNRGDCADGTSGCTCDQAAEGSGALSLYNQFRISRIP